jgi:K(+)-stimulated pyrophosphate-energized sodium pump
MALPVIYAMVGLLASLVGIFLMRVFAKGNPATALRLTTFVAAGLFLVLAYFVTVSLPLDMVDPEGIRTYSAAGPFWAVLAGSIAG